MRKHFIVTKIERITVMKKTMLALAFVAMMGCDTDKDEKDKSITILELGGSSVVCQDQKCECVKNCTTAQPTTPVPPQVIVPKPIPTVTVTPTPCPTTAPQQPQPSDNIGINIDVQSSSSSSSTSGSTTQVSQSQGQCQKQYDFDQEGLFTCKYRCPGKPPCLDKGRWTPIQNTQRTASLVYETQVCGSPSEETLTY